MASTDFFESGLNKWQATDKPTRTDFVNDNEIMDSFMRNIPTAAMPSGLICPFGGTSAPAGWFLCYGQSVSRTAYPGLFAAIGTIYGTGDGSTTFTLPDLRGRFTLGCSGTHAHGGKGGRELVSANELPKHQHTIPQLSGVAEANQSAHQHTFKDQVTGAEREWVAIDSENGPDDTTFGATIDYQRGYKLHVGEPIQNGSHTHTIKTGPAETEYHGTSDSMNILNPYTAVNYIIKC